MDAKDVAQALTLTQIAQMIVSLGVAIQTAVAAGKDSVTADEVAASFADKDAALVGLAAAIARAKAEGR